MRKKLLLPPLAERIAACNSCNTMKIANAPQSTSFYETFSDLIFATMAIFVLLMIIFIVQVNLEEGLEELEKKIADEMELLETKKQELKEQKTENEKLTNAEKSLQQYNFEIVIAVDITGSMQREIDKLTDTIGLIGKVLPQIAHSVKIGIVAYRRDEKDKLAIKTFPLQVIKAENEDNKKSYRRVHDWVRGLRAKPGSAPVELAMDQALKMFSSPDKFTGHQTFMFLGDVGPFEDKYRDQSIDSRNREQADAMVDQLKIWVDQQFHRNVLILFSGEDEIAKTLRLQGPNGRQHQKFLQSRKLFQRFAKETGQPESYTTDSSEMIPSLLSAILK